MRNMGMATVRRVSYCFPQRLRVVRECKISRRWLGA